MAEVTRTSGTTTLAWGKLRAEVGLYKTVGKPPKEADFETERRPMEVVEAVHERLATPVEEASESDPLALGGANSQDSWPEVAVQEPVAASKPKPRKGIYRDDESFLDLTDRLKAIEDATTLDEMRIVGFITRRALRLGRIKDSYYLGPQDPTAAKILALLSIGMDARKRFPVFKWTKRTRQAVGVLVFGPRDSLLVLEMEWASVWRDPSEKCLRHLDAHVEDSEAKLAVELVDAMTAPPEALDALEDDAMVMRQQLRAAAEAGLVDQWEAPTVDERAPTEDVRAALAESLS